MKYLKIYDDIKKNKRMYPLSFDGCLLFPPLFFYDFENKYIYTTNGKALIRTRINPFDVKEFGKENKVLKLGNNNSTKYPPYERVIPKRDPNNSTLSKYDTNTLLKIIKDYIMGMNKLNIKKYDKNNRIIVLNNSKKETLINIDLLYKTLQTLKNFRDNQEDLCINIQDSGFCHIYNNKTDIIIMPVIENSLDITLDDKEIKSFFGVLCL